MCKARLSWRSPPRLSRCRTVLPLEAGTGATPASRANAASERTRPWCNQAMITSAATIGPTPGSSSRCERADVGEDFALELFCFGGRGLDPARERAQDELRGQLVDGKRVRSRKRLQRSSRHRSGSAYNFSRSGSGAVTITLRSCTSARRRTSRAPARDQQQSQRFASLAHPRQDERLARQRRACGTDRVERVVFAAQPPLVARATAAVDSLRLVALVAAGYSGPRTSRDPGVASGTIWPG